MVLEGGTTQLAPSTSVPISRASKNPWKERAPREYRGWLKNHQSMGRKAGQTSGCLSALVVLFSRALSGGTEMMLIHAQI